MNSKDKKDFFYKIRIQIPNYRIIFLNLYMNSFISIWIRFLDFGYKLTALLLRWNTFLF
jgi:hypothetical protein